MYILQNIINYNFTNKDLLKIAITHKSYINDTNYNNERLEFLGDAVLDLIISKILIDKFSHKQEGDLSTLRAHLVCEKNLASVARNLNLQNKILLTSGSSSITESDSVLADLLEALIGAIYLDSNFDVAFGVVSIWFEDNITNIDDIVQANLNYKSLLQELLQKNNFDLPVYSIIQTTGPEHNKCFLVECKISALNVCTTGYAKTKKLAEREAAKQAYIILKNTKIDR